MRTILYITYDGLTDSLGQSQILAYLKRLSRLNNKIVILSFEKEDLYKKTGENIRQIVDESGLTWVHLSYTKKPPVASTLFDIYKGYRICKQLHQQHQFQLVHCRGYIPAILGRKMQKKFGLKFIFDMRGWWPDEKLESGYWDSSVFRPVYQYFKRLERSFFADCDYAVSLTHKGKEEIVGQKLADGDKVGVIPTCVDFEIFKERNAAVNTEVRGKLGVRDNEKVFVYSGSLGGNYDPETLIAVFKKFRQVYPDSFLLILSKDAFTTDLQQLFKNAGIERMAMLNAPFTQVTNYLRAADVGFIYYKMSFSVIGRSPTKMGEYWASGVPVIAFKDIGDLDYILAQYPGSGVLLSVNDADAENKIKDLPFIAPEQLRQYALDYFHVEKGVRFYQSVYEQLAPSKNIYEYVTATDTL
jgi:glycosyltransferase involved in cell wall biosynthesis